jgi:GNAT superfamily N-acetyltransferase
LKIAHGHRIPGSRSSHEAPRERTTSCYIRTMSASSPTDIALRVAGPQDSALILRFIQQLAEYERQPDAVKATEEVLRQQLSAARPPFECIVAELDGAPAGFALFFHTYSTWLARPGLWLEDLFVPPEFRGRGVGAALFRRIGAIAHERGCGRFEWSVLDWNQLARDFYARFGARLMDEWLICRIEGDALAQFDATL